mgnify:CR=1 FL=1
MTLLSTQITEGFPLWENISTNSRYGRYATEIEKRAILKGLTHTAKPTTALEIGCDGGRWTKLLSDLGWNIICTDIDKQSLNICQKRVPTATCVHVNPEDSRFPCDTDSIGLLLCIEVAPVINADWFFDEASRVLQKGGWIVGVMWNRFSWRGWLYHHLPGLRVTGSGHWYWYPISYEAWRKRFCQKGYTIVYEEGYAWLPSRRTSNSHLIPFAANLEHFLGLRKLVSLSPMITFVAQKI